MKNIFQNVAEPCALVGFGDSFNVILLAYLKDDISGFVDGHGRQGHRMVAVEILTDIWDIQTGVGLHANGNDGVMIVGGGQGKDHSRGHLITPFFNVFQNMILKDFDQSFGAH